VGLEFEDVAVMDEPVQQCAEEAVVLKDLVSFGEGQVVVMSSEVRR